MSSSISSPSKSLESTRTNGRADNARVLSTNVSPEFISVNLTQLFSSFTSIMLNPVTVKSKVV